MAGSLKDLANKNNPENKLFRVFVKRQPDLNW